MDELDFYGHWQEIGLTKSKCKARALGTGNDVSHQVLNLVASQQLGTPTRLCRWNSSRDL